MKPKRMLKQRDGKMIQQMSIQPRPVAPFPFILQGKGEGGDDTVAMDKDEGLKKDLIKEQKQALINSAVIPFEFPRQKTDGKSDPAIMQFTASQKLLNPNQMGSWNNNNQKGTQNVVGVRPVLVHFNQRPLSSSAQNFGTESSSDPNVAEEPKPNQQQQQPRFVPGVNKRKFTHSRFYDRLRYLVRLPLANSLTRGVTGLCILVATNHIIAYAWKGSEHPLNRYRWNQMKEKGELSAEMLEKEQLLADYVVDNFMNPQEHLPRVRTIT